jgi:hypothetical protein
MSPPFGNTIFEATIPLSVTFIMTQFALLLKAGIHPKIVSERLGHANIAITLDIYSHVLPGLQERAAERFDEMLETKAIVEDVSKMFAKSSSVDSMGR